MASCVALGCRHEVSKEGHKLRLPHWKLQKEGKLHECPRCKAWSDSSACLACPPANDLKPEGPREDILLSSTKIGEKLGLSSQKVNLILSELGWIEKYVKGWVPASPGESRGAVRRDARQTGIPYVVWPGSILENGILAGAVGEIEGKEPVKRVAEGPRASLEPTKHDSEAAQDFRSRFPAQMRAMDGHQVRSRAEVMICNWLYTQATS